MSGKFKHTSQRVLANRVLEMIDWHLERSEQQKRADVMLGSLEQNMGRAPAGRVLNTMQVERFRDDALRAQSVVGASKGFCSTFKRLNQQRGS
jgi:hypothetical protein